VFEGVCRSVGVKNFVFHDFRHTFVTNMRRAGVDYFRIMAISGHRTVEVFKRYHTIDQGNLRLAMNQLDTYMDIEASEGKEKVPYVIENN
jgi:integrase